jgi:hypothetical protein
MALNISPLCLQLATALSQSSPGAPFDFPRPLLSHQQDFIHSQVHFPFENFSFDLSLFPCETIPGLSISHVGSRAKSLADECGSS